jgi:hypothetical protein
VHMSTKLRIRIKKLVDPELDLKLDYGELTRPSILIWSKRYKAIIQMKISIILGTRPEIIKMSKTISQSEVLLSRKRNYKYEEDTDKELEIHFLDEVR